jgi:hypothetical protein
MAAGMLLNLGTVLELTDSYAFASRIYVEPEARERQQPPGSSRPGAAADRWRQPAQPQSMCSRTVVPQVPERSSTRSHSSFTTRRPCPPPALAGR